VGKLGSGLIALSCISLLLLGAKAADRNESTVIRAGTVEAQDFLLKDEDGRIYARLSLNPGKKLMKQDRRVYMIPNQENSGSGCVGVSTMRRANTVWTVPGEAEFRPLRPQKTVTNMIYSSPQRERCVGLTWPSPLSGA